MDLFSFLIPQLVAPVCATLGLALALPYITAKGRDPDRIATAVELAIRDLDQSDRDALHLKGLVRIPKADYMAVPTPPGP